MKKKWIDKLIETVAQKQWEEDNKPPLTREVIKRDIQSAAENGCTGRGYNKKEVSQEDIEWLKGEGFGIEYPYEHMEDVSEKMQSILITWGREGTNK